MLNKATICSIIGCIGVVSTAVLSVECYKKTDELDDVSTTLKKYTPAIISGGISIGCILSADRINKKEIMLLTGALSYFGQKMAAYEKEVREQVGDEKADEIERAFYAKQIEKHTNHKLLETSNTPKFIDKFSGAEICAPYEDVQKALKKCEELYGQQDYLCWCDVFYLINKSTNAYESDLGEQIGWSRGMYQDWYDTGSDNPYDLKFEIKNLGPNRYLISYNLEPSWGFMEY